MDNFKSIEQRLIKIESLLLGTKTVLTFNEAAEYCGLSRSYLYKLTSAGLVPHFKPSGKMLYFSKAELDTWLLKGAVKSNCAIESEAINHVILNRKVAAKKN